MTEKLKIAKNECANWNVGNCMGCMVYIDSGYLERNIYVELEKVQKLKYQKTLREREKINSSYLKIYNKLKEICDLDPDTGSSAKIEYILDLL